MMVLILFPNLSDLCAFKREHDSKSYFYVIRSSGKAQGKGKSEKEINGEIKAVIRQITATVTFLPLIETACKYSELRPLFIRWYLSMYKVVIDQFVVSFIYLWMINRAIFIGERLL